jgi:hypothetical protein
MAGSYYLAARYKSTTHSGNVTALLRAIAYLDKQSLSVYAVQATKGLYVVIVGEEPPVRTQQRLYNALVNGVRVRLRPHDIDSLYKRYRAEHPERR